MESDNCVILGHSFVKGLVDHYDHLFKDHHPAAFERYVAHDLKVSEHVGGVFLFGKSGATVQSFATPPSLLLKNINPRICLLEMGTNDLVAGIQPDILAGQLLDLAKFCRDSFGSVVGILSVLPRDENLQQLTPLAFREVMHALEIHLKQLVSSEEKIFYHKHKGFYEVEHEGKKLELEVKTWSKDGIHPNMPQGRQKYKNSLRNAICKALKLI